MAGLKTFWILIYSLLLLAACVPQTKQTECQGNEAFNAALRTCVPVVGGPSSFINVATYTPAFTQTRHKADTTTLTFSISVSNPYNQTYTIAWERVFNGAPVSMCSNALTCSFPASFLGTTLGEVGTHILTAKIVDGTGTVVDTHSFELKINELPKPIINTASISPSQYAFTVTPGSPSSSFSFNIKNNQATMAPGDYYRTEWTIEKNGAIIYTEIDPFPNSNLSPAGTNYAYLGTSPTPYFNPSTLGVGSYVVRAVVKNDVPGEVVDEHQWNVTVNHPALKKINNRDIYEGTNNPGPGTTSIAYNGIAYNAYTPTLAINFIPLGHTNQGDYCVSVEDGEGTYTGDGLFVKVNFFIDGATQIYSGTTTALDPKICLSDASATTLNTMLFSNTTTTGSQNHTLVARVVDEATNQEYTSFNMQPALGNYPVTWDFLVKPANAAPTITFATTTTPTNLTCSTPLGNAQTCSVAQDTHFTVGINALDDFYLTNSTDDLQQDRFTYSMTLMKNGTPLSTCTKTTANTLNNTVPTWNAGTSTWTNDDFVGPEYHCGFVVPSYDVNGPVNPLTNFYTVVINFSDVGSPIPGTTGATSNTIIYNLNVTEKNTAPTIQPQLATLGNINADSYISKNAATTTVINPGTTLQFVTEGDTMTFHVRVNDSERDNHQIFIYKCTDFTSNCLSFSLMTTAFVTKTNNASHTLTAIGYPIPEDFLPVTALTTEPPSANAFFKVVVTDCPSILNGTDANINNCNVTAAPSGTTTTPRLTTSSIFQVKMINKNPAPQFGGTPNPLTTASLTTMVGYPLTIYPGTVTDASLILGENNISYQWYIDTDSSIEDNYTAITGATEQILRWTPSNGLTSTSVGLALCVSDGTSVNPFPATVHTTLENPVLGTGANCKRRWVVTVRKNAVPVAFNGSTGDAGSSVAVWQDNTGTLADKKVIYTAYTDINENIFIEKTVFNANGVIYNNETTGFRTVSFPALPSGTAADNSVKDISLAGTPTHLYIAYQAADSSNPGAPKIRMRRIDKRYGVIGVFDFGSKTDPSYPHPGKFGFAYDTPTSLLPTTTDPEIAINQAIQSITVLFEPLGLTASSTLTTNTLVMTAASPASTVNQLCSGGSCTTGANAIRYRDFINTSSNRLLQGLTASASGSTTTLYGGLSGSEYLDSNPTLSSYVTGKLGDLMIFDIGGGNYRWYLPFIDKTTGSTLDHIRVLSADAQAASVLNSSLTLDDNVVYSSLGAVSYFTNDSDNSNQIVIGSVKSSTNVASLNVYLLGANLPSLSSVFLFGGSVIDPTSLRFSAPVSGNNNYFVAAKVLTTLPSTYEWMIGRCDSSLFCVNNTLTTSGAAYNPATAALLTVNSLKDLSIESYPSSAGSNEARMLINSGTGLTTSLYALRFRSDGDVSCGLCIPINVSGNLGTTMEKLSPIRSVATSKIDPNMAIGTPGSSLDAPTEHIRDVLFSVYPVQTGAGIYTPHMGIINVEAMTINSTDSTITGLSGSRPAFFGDN